LHLPFVVTFHALGRVRRQFQGEADRFPDERFAIEDRIVAEADALIAECPQDEEDLIRLYNADPGRITIVPAGFDPDEFRPMSRPLARLDLDLDPTERVVLQLGRLVPRKGVDNVIRSVARLRDEGLAVRLLIVGGIEREPDPARDAELARLMGVAAEEGVADRVTFVGRRDRDELATYYNAADVFISTPWYEPFGITPLEAMACGVPVIGSNVGGIKFSVRDGETGYLVPPNDPDALAGRIAHLYRHPKLLSVLGRQASRRATDLFTWERVVAGLSAVYDDVLSATRRTRKVEREATREIASRFDVLIATLRASRSQLPGSIVRAADALTACFANDGKVLVAGNGGSASEAQHLAAEFVGRFKVPGRPAMPVLALGTDGAVLTAWSNDVGFDDVFARQVEAFGRRGDVLVGLSTSGCSPNLLRAFEAARERGMTTIGLLGGSGGDLRALADVPVVVPSTDTQQIQEVHMVLVHLLTETVERRLAEAGWFGELALPAAWPAAPAGPAGPARAASPQARRSSRAARGRETTHGARVTR
jgi:phosphoheptose isomerase